MTPRSINVTLGTAGHIDHGKTALVKSLTGCDTDRLKEEKERGMTIDLGYAPCRVEDLEVGLVDVPGHENFIKTMVAGASGMDGVIFVVAADDGIMPQTREHLDILTLLGVRHGIVALTKIDRVEPDHLLAVQADLTAMLAGTFLAGAPILPVSNVTGQGFDGFFEALLALIRSIPPRSCAGVFRMPLDRAFSAKGFGTIAAGIPIAGSAAVGDEIVLLPQGAESRVKRIEVYGKNSEVVRAGECAAVNLGHIDARDIARGDVVATPGYFSPEQGFLCRMKWLPHEKIKLKHGGEVKFHTGTTETPAVVYFLDEEEMRGGSEHYIQVMARRPIVAGPNDPFIIRSLSPVLTVGGGKIIEAAPRRLKRNKPGVLEDVQRRAEAVQRDETFVEYAVRHAENRAAGEPELAQRTKTPRPRLREILAALVRDQKVVALTSGLYLHKETARESGKNVLDQLAAYHQSTPESPGMSLDQLRQVFSWERPVLEAVLLLLKRESKISERAQRFALVEHKVTFRDKDAEYLDAVEKVFLAQLFSPPDIAELMQKTGAPAATLQKIVRSLKEQQRLVAVDQEMLFHREAVDRAKNILVEYIQKEGKLESVQFKYLVDTTRKYALPLLDYFDRTLLRRVGNTRFLK